MCVCGGGGEGGAGRRPIHHEIHERAKRLSRPGCCNNTRFNFSITITALGNNAEDELKG